MPWKLTRVKRVNSCVLILNDPFPTNLEYGPVQDRVESIRRLNNFCLQRLFFLALLDQAI